MNKKHYLSLVLILSIIVCMVPFSSVKAATTIEYMDDESDSVTDIDGNIYGDFDVYVAKASSGTKLQFNFLDQYYSYDQYMTAYIVHINLNTKYTGVIQVSMGTAWGSFENWWFESDGSITSTASNTQGTGYWNLNLYDVQQATLVWLDQSAYNLNYVPQFLNGETNLVPSDPLDVNISGLADYQIPWYQLTAYAFATQSMSQVQYTDGDVAPYINITSGSRSRTVSVPASGDRHFIFIASSNLTGGVNAITSSNNNVLATYVIVQNYTFSGGYRMYNLTLANSSNSSQNVYVTYNNTFDMIPIYFGSIGQMPEDVYSVIMGNHIYDNSLQRIINILNESYNDSSTSDAIDSVTDDLTDITSDIDDIEADIDDLFDTHITNIDLDDYDIFDDMANTNLFFKTYLDDVFTNLGDFKAIIIVPVIVTVMMIMIGWVF